MDKINSALAFFEAALTHAHAVSIVLGLAIAIGFTQWAKFPLRLYTDSRRYPLAVFRFLTRTIAASVGLAVTWVAWPDPGKWGFLWGCVTGFFAPPTYTVIIRVVGHFWPWLASKASTDAFDATDEAGA